ESDSPLAQSMEAIGSAFAIPAATTGKQLSLASPVDPIWLSNAQAAQAIAARWWGYRHPGIIADGGVRTAATSAIGQRIGLCFTCGVDSFHSLLRDNQKIDHLMFVLGYDIELADLPR